MDGISKNLVYTREDVFDADEPDNDWVQPNYVPVQRMTWRTAYRSWLQQNGNAEFTYDLIYVNDDDIPEIPCDPKRMRQVFLNILDNAAKHGGEGEKIQASIHDEGDFVVVRIRDFGPGIPEDEIPLVKKKFYKGSSKARGSGIGLAVCDEIVEMHGGALILENAEGGGTLVTIRLPATQ